ncbi:MAG: DHH family phosphoesterase, partial [Acidobacteriota bacterium]
MAVSSTNSQCLSAPAPAAASGDPLEAILAILRRGRRFLVCSHVRPDGDALGSMLACGMMLEQMGKQADLVCA